MQKSWTTWRMPKNIQARLLTKETWVWAIKGNRFTVEDIALIKESRIATGQYEQFFEVAGVQWRESAIINPTHTTRERKEECLETIKSTWHESVAEDHATQLEAAGIR